MDDNIETTNRSAFVKIIVKYESVLVSLLTHISVFCFSIMTIIVLIGIVMRFLLKIPNMYGEELSRYLMVYGIFLGIAVGVRSGAHMCVEGVLNRFPPKIERILTIIGKSISIAGYGVMTYCSIVFTIHVYGFGQTSPALGLPMFVMYTALAVGFFLSTIYEGLLFWDIHITQAKILKGKKEEILL